MDVYEALGLTEGEEKVYRALVALTKSTTGPIYKKAKVSQSKVYEILDRLQKKGLAAYAVINNITYWSPAHPRNYLEHVQDELKELEARKKILEEKLPSIIVEEPDVQDEAQVYVGYNGFKSVLYRFLETFEAGDEHIFFGAANIVEGQNATFLKKHLRKMLERGVTFRFIYGNQMRDFVKDFYSDFPVQGRYISGSTPTTTLIGKDRVLLIMYREPVKVIEIRGKDLAESYKAFFESIWAMAKE
jgi:sugar-specific transcriptional regulator TrmB